jgi:hypothetical protein
MTQYLLAPYREDAVPVPLELTQQVSASVNALGDKLMNAGALVIKTGLLPAGSTAVRVIKEQAS